MVQQDEFDTELDLLQRYEKMVDAQVQTIRGIDDKAAFTGRLIAILAGLILTAASIAISSKSIEVSDASTSLLIILGIGSIALFTSLVFAIITYLSTRFVYGPPTGVGMYMADHSVDSQQYKNLLLKGYSQGIKSNKDVILKNSKWFKYCLASLLGSLMFYFGAGAILIIPDILILESFVIYTMVNASGILSLFIVRGDYLTLDDQHSLNERI